MGTSHGRNARLSEVGTMPTIDETLTYIQKDSITFRPDYLSSLFLLARQVPPKGTIVEIGCYRGDSTIALLAGSHPTVQVVTIDPIFASGEYHYPDCNTPEGLTLRSDFETFKQRVWNFPGDPGRLSSRLVAIPTTSAEALDGWKKGEWLIGPGVWGKEIDYVLIDGEHGYNAVQIDSQWLDYIKPGGLAIYDDWLDEIERSVRNFITSRPEWSIVHESTKGTLDGICVTYLKKD